jgi:signal transduction histidine kinase
VADPSPFAAGEQTRQLRGFLRPLLVLVAVFVGLEIALSIVFDDPQMMAAGILIGGYWVVVAAALLMLRRGRLREAAAATWVGILFVAVATAAVQPAIFPELAIIPLVALGVAINFVRGRALLFTAVTCWIGAIAIVALGILRPIPSTLPEPVLAAFHLVAVAAASGLVIILLGQFSDRLTSALLATQRAIDDLRIAETERRTAERLLLERQRDESLGVLAGGIAHDFNNLLSSVIGNVELARMDAPAGSAQDRSLDEVREAADRAAELSRKMLAYSGHGAFVKRPVDVREVVNGLHGLLTHLLPSGVALRLDLPDRVPSVHADEAQLSQIIVNLAMNAGEAIAEAPESLTDQRVTIRVSVVQLDAAAVAAALPTQRLEPGEYIAIDVTDTGHGMDDATKAQAFEPFFSTRFVGRGLGLSVVLGVVRGHGGAITIDSGPGRGTQIRVLLPVAPPVDV